jgi:hypothetical protein
MCDFEFTLSEAIAAVSALPMPSANKHILLVLYGRLHSGDHAWPGSENLAIDTSIPQGLVSKSILFLQQHKIIHLKRSLNGQYVFMINDYKVKQAAFPEEC